MTVDHETHILPSFRNIYRSPPCCALGEMEDRDGSGAEKTT